jgi:hypothetical protein
LKESQQRDLEQKIDKQRQKEIEYAIDALQALHKSSDPNIAKQRKNIRSRKEFDLPQKVSKVRKRR